MPVEKVPSWIKQVLMPELSEIKGELKAINTRIDSTNERIDSLRNEMLSKFEAENIKIDSLTTEMTVRLDSIEKRIPVIEEITALKLKLAEIERKLAVV